MPRQERLIVCTFLVLQMLDGTMTYAGVRLLGPQVELNAVLAWYMDALGAGLAILLAKALACGCGWILYVAQRHRTLAVLSGIYVGLAVVPWVLTLAGL